MDWLEGGVLVRCYYGCPCGCRCAEGEDEKEEKKREGGRKQARYLSWAPPTAISYRHVVRRYQDYVTYEEITHGSPYNAQCSLVTQIHTARAPTAFILSPRGYSPWIP